MKLFTFRLFGVPFLSVEVADLEFAEEEVESTAVGGGSSHNFTLADTFVDERFVPYEDEFGFKGDW